MMGPAGRTGIGRPRRVPTRPGGRGRTRTTSPPVASSTSATASTTASSTSRPRPAPRDPVRVPQRDRAVRASDEPQLDIVGGDLHAARAVVDAQDQRIAQDATRARSASSTRTVVGVEPRPSRAPTPAAGARLQVGAREGGPRFLGEDLGRRAVEDHASGPHDHDPLEMLRDECHVVADGDDGPALRAELSHDRSHACDAPRVLPGGRLVEHHHGGAHGEHGRDGQQLAPGVPQVVRVGADLVREAHGLERRSDRGIELGAIESDVPGTERHLAPDRPGEDLAIGVLEGHADEARQLRDVPVTDPTPGD